MEWKAFGFRLSQLNEAVTITGESAAVLQPEAVKGFPSGGDAEYFDLARADVVREAVSHGVYDYVWRVSYPFTGISEEVKKYLIEEVGFRPEWFENFGEFPLEKYQPPEDYFGHPMHFGFRVRTDVCNSLTVAGGAAEVDRYGVANKPFWREAFFGYTLPIITTFNFVIDSSEYRIEDIGTMYDSSEHAYIAYPAIGVAPGCSDFPEGKLGYGAFWPELIGGAIYYPVGPSGWAEQTDSRALRTVTVSGVRYFYAWLSPDPNDFVWGRCTDLTLRYKFANAHKDEPIVKLTATSISIQNIRGAFSYDIRVDVEAIRAANAWEPSYSEADAVYAAVVAAERAAEANGFFSIAMWNNPMAMGVYSSGRIVLPSGYAGLDGIITMVDGWDTGLTASDLNALYNEWTSVAPIRLGYYYRVIILAAHCEWTRTDRHRLDFSNGLEGYYAPDARFPGEEGSALPVNGSIGAEAFVTQIGGNPSEPGSVAGEIWINPLTLESGPPAAQRYDFNLSWSIVYVKQQQ